MYCYSRHEFKLLVQLLLKAKPCNSDAISQWHSKLKTWNCIIERRNAPNITLPVVKPAFSRIERNSRGALHRLYQPQPPSPLLLDLIGCRLIGKVLTRRIGMQCDWAPPTRVSFVLYSTAVGHVAWLKQCVRFSQSKSCNRWFSVTRSLALQQLGTHSARPHRQAWLYAEPENRRGVLTPVEPRICAFAEMLSRNKSKCIMQFRMLIILCQTLFRLQAWRVTINHITHSPVI